MEEPEMERSTDCPGVDRISELPDDILRLILTRMPLLDAGLTTTFAKRWRHLVHEIPDLRIDGKFFNEEGLLEAFEYCPETFSDFVKFLLCRHTPISKCVVQSVAGNWYGEDFDWMISRICSLGVRDLTLYGDGNCDEMDETDLYEIPDAILACDSLYRLYLSTCKLVVPPVVTGLSRLRTLMLCSVTLPDDHVERLVSQCRHLEELQLFFCPLMSNIVIRSTSLLTLKVTFYSKINLFIEKAPCLSDVRIHICDPCTFDDDESDNEDGVNDENDTGEVAQPEAAVVVKQGGQVRWFLQNLRALRHIRSLDLYFEDGLMQELLEDKVPLPQRLPFQFENLKKIQLKMVFSSGYLISIVSCLIINSPNVEELIIDEIWWELDTWSVEEDPWNHFELLGCIANWPMYTTLLIRSVRLEVWIGIIKLVVICAPALKNMSIRYRCVPDEKTEENIAFENARRQLLLLQQLFPHVTLELTSLGTKKYW